MRLLSDEKIETIANEVGAPTSRYFPYWRTTVDLCRAIEAAVLQAQPTDQRLLNLLCRIHRDGGHYIAEHGLDKAVEDADIRVAEQNAALEAQGNAKLDRGDGVDALLHAVFQVCEATEEIESKNDFERGRVFEAKHIRNGIGNWFQDTFCGKAFMGEPVLEAQGKQEPVAFGWRDVAEELPTEAQEVLFVRGDKVVHGAWIGGIFLHSNTKMAAAKWMPLPPVDLPPLYTAPVVQPDDIKDAARYRMLRNGEYWPAAFYDHDEPEPLRGEELDAAMAAMAAEKEQS